MSSKEESTSFIIRTGAKFGSVPALGEDDIWEFWKDIDDAVAAPLDDMADEI